MTTLTSTEGLIDVLTSYRDLCNEIEYFEVLLAETQKEWQINRKMMFKNPSPLSGGYVPIGMERVAENMDKIIERHNNIERLLEAKKELKKQAEKIINSFEGIDYKVAYKRFVENKKLECIASELNYSVDGVKKISARIKKALTVHRHVDKKVI